MRFLSRSLFKARLKRTCAKVRKLAEAGEFPAAWEAAQPLLTGEENDSAEALLALIGEESFTYEDSQAAAGHLVDHHARDVALMASLGDLSEKLVDMRYLNEAAPAGDAIARLVQTLDDHWRTTRDSEREAAVVSGLASAARIAGRAYDDRAEAAARRRAELAPDNWARFYDLGLLYKTRGKFGQGVNANQRAADLLRGDVEEAVVWNLGICATGAGDGDAALRAWRTLGLEVERGDDGLPTGQFGQCKVRLAQYPLAERGPERDADGPGAEETIWIERLSPCHGIVRSALYQDEVGVEFGDVVLFDGAPIVHHRVGDHEVPVFPHLATLARRGYHVYRFTGTQEHREQLSELACELSADAIIYVHDESFRVVCRECWENPDSDHDHRGDEDDQTFVSGKLVAPPDMAPGVFLHELDELMNRSPRTRLYAPALARDAGDHARADVEERRLAMIQGAPEP